MAPLHAPAAVAAVNKTIAGLPGNAARKTGETPDTYGIWGTRKAASGMMRRLIP